MRILPQQWNQKLSLLRSKQLQTQWKGSLLHQNQARSNQPCAYISPFDGLFDDRRNLNDYIFSTIDWIKKISHRSINLKERKWKWRRIDRLLQLWGKDSQLDKKLWSRQITNVRLSWCWRSINNRHHQTLTVRTKLKSFPRRLRLPTDPVKKNPNIIIKQFKVDIFSKSYVFHLVYRYSTKQYVGISANESYSEFKAWQHFEFYVQFFKQAKQTKLSECKVIAFESVWQRFEWSP